MYTLISEFVGTRMRAFAAKGPNHFRFLLIARLILWPLSVTLIPALIVLLHVTAAVVHGVGALLYYAGIHLVGAVTISWEWISEASGRVWKSITLRDRWSDAYWAALYAKPVPLPATDADDDAHHSEMSGYVDQDAE